MFKQADELDIRDAVVPKTESDAYEEEYIVKGTEYKTWNHIWYVSSVSEQHMCGSISHFKCIRHSYGIETRFENHNVIYIRGLGEVTLNLDGKEFVFSSVYYTPNLGRNILSLKQLKMQGFSVVTEGDKCNIKNMFDEAEMVIPGLFDIRKFEKDCETMYFDLLDQSRDSTIRKRIEDMISSYEIKSYEDCIGLLDLIENTQSVWGYRDKFKIKFNEMLQWFIHSYLLLSNRPIPPLVNMHNRFELFDLYVIMKLEGGYNRISEYNLWPLIIKELGLDVNDIELVKVIYIQYLDVLVWNYEVIKKDRNKHDGKYVVNGEELLGVDSVNEREYALYMGNDWIGVKSLIRRKRFDFNKATNALLDAMVFNQGSASDKEEEKVEECGSESSKEEGSNNKVASEDEKESDDGGEWIKIKNKKIAKTWKPNGISWTKAGGWKKAR